MLEEITKLDKVESGIQREAEKEEVLYKAPDYTDDEKQYLGRIKLRLERAKQDREQPFEFFDGMPYEWRCQHNRRLANSYTKPRESRHDTNFTTGTTRQKLLTGLASLNDLNLSADITAFDENKVAHARAGEALEDIIEEEKENDNEKRLMREYTMIEQGEVFVEVGVDDGARLRKNMTNYKEGKFRNVEINSKYEKAISRLTTNVIRNEKVFLGDISVYEMGDQPFIFTIEHKSYSELEAIFGDWEMWPYVKYSMTSLDKNTEIGKEESLWQLVKPREGFCEIVRYQSKSENEAQIFINGIPMFPIGYPLEEISPDIEYTIEKQVYEIIDAQFAYGKSQMQRLKNAQGLEDAFWRTSIFKAKQQAKPPLVNNTGKMLSESIFMPASMVHNIPEGKLYSLLGDAAGISSSEAKMMEMLRDNLNDNSSEPQMAGQQPEGTPTATQIQTVQQQAEKMIGLTVFSASLLEKKIVNRMIPLILSHYLEPVSERVDSITGVLKKVYRRFNVEKQVDDKGAGQEIVEIVDKDRISSPIQLLKEEKEIEQRTGLPTRKVTINRDAINVAKWTWRTRIIPKPKRSTELEKERFQQKTQIYAQSPNFSMDWYEQNAALTWGDNPRKVFKRTNRQKEQAPQMPETEGGRQQPNTQTSQLTAGSRKNEGENQAA